MHKILLVQDDAFLINVYASQLRKSGYSTTIALNGDTAVSRIRKINPDLLILDVNSPKIDGLSVLRKIRGDKDLRKTKVAVLTNFDQEEKNIKCAEFGIIKFFSKTEDTLQEITESIKKILS